MVDGGSSLDILMDSDDMSGPLELLGELLVTVVTLEAINLVKLLMLVEVILSFKAPPAILHPAEEGTGKVHLTMNPHGLVMDCLVSTN